MRKNNMSPIDSPYNSNEYLINNQSSPFYDEDSEDEFRINFIDNDYLVGNDIDIKDIGFYSENKMDSTSDESEIINNLNNKLKKEDIYINNVN